MPPAEPPDQTLISLLQVAFLAWGAVIWWKFQFVSSTAAYRVLRLPFWPISAQGFFFNVFLVLAGGLGGGTLAGLTISHLPSVLKGDAPFVTIFAGAGFDLGILIMLLMGGKLPAWLRPSEPVALIDYPVPDARVSAEPISPSLPLASVPKAGFFTYLAALPVVVGVQQGWFFVLEKFHIDAPHQVLIDFLKDTHGIFKITFFVALTVFIGPITEEVIFRAGVFRYLRQNLPRWSAFMISAVLFATLHLNLSSFAPLVVLAYVLALSYERTGRIAVPIIAHALFNLTSLLLLMTGQSN